MPAGRVSGCTVIKERITGRVRLRACTVQGHVQGTTLILYPFGYVYVLCIFYVWLDAPVRTHTRSGLTHAMRCPAIYSGRVRYFQRGIVRTARQVPWQVQPSEASAVDPIVAVRERAIADCGLGHLGVTRQPTPPAVPVPALPPAGASPAGGSVRVFSAPPAALRGRAGGAWARALARLRA